MQPAVAIAVLRMPGVLQRCTARHSAAAAHLALGVAALSLQRPHFVRLAPAVLKQLVHMWLARALAPRRQRRRLRQKANGQAAARRWVQRGGRGPQPPARSVAGELRGVWIARLEG